jgi:hypothetical protein
MGVAATRCWRICQCEWDLIFICELLTRFASTLDAKRIALQHLQGRFNLFMNLSNLGKYLALESVQSHKGARRMTINIDRCW